MNKYEEAYERLCSKEYHYPDHDSVYADIETLGELVEKAIPKKPIGKYTDYKCPVCGRRVRSGKGSSSFTRDNVCQRCFQTLKWEEEDDE